MISFDEALEIVCAQARPLGAQQVPIADAHRRTLAEPVVAQVDSPPADVSAMDGYALRDTELAGGLTEFRLAGESFPGAGFEGELASGACVRIFTGAPVPPLLDRVVVQENVHREGDLARIETAPSAARHIRPRASDFAIGDVLLEAGRLLNAQALVAAAGADQEKVTVWREPRVALLGTGDELVDPGQARTSPGTIPESLSPGIAALAAEWGGRIVGRYRLPDVPATIERAAAEALEKADLVVVTGGASVGEKDYAKSVLAALGLDLLFSKVAIKPGKPVWFGRARGRLVLGLPGNPTSAMVTARLLLAPLVRGLCGRDPRSALQWRRVRLAESLAACGDRETFIRARWKGEDVEPLSNQDSGAQRTLAGAELLIRRLRDAPAAPVGDLAVAVDF